MERPTVTCSAAALVALAFLGYGETGGPTVSPHGHPESTIQRSTQSAPFIFGIETERSKAAAGAVADFVSQGEIEEDLHQFRVELEERFAYLRYNEPDYLSAIQAILDNAAGGMSVDDFDIELTKVLALFIDCHAAIDGGGLPVGYLPFRLEAIGERYLALWADRSDFVMPSYPYITKIDGMSIDEWRSALQVMVQRGSAQWVTYLTLRYLEYIRFARSIAGVEDPEVIEVELESRDRSERVTTTFDVASQRPTVEAWPDAGSGFIDGNVGYLRITGWDEDAFDEVARWMPQFAAARGIIIDIRHNFGGTRLVLRELYPYFVTASDPPHVANAAKYRLYSGFSSDHLTGRYMFREDSYRWTSEERSAISAFMESFEPEWVVPESEFSEWHFWLVSKASNPGAHDYPGRVIFLMDSKCFSASDVILSSVKGRPNITLVGEPSMGGSGARIITTLRNSGLDLYLSSMASFQNTGLLFDSRGVEPDWLIRPQPEYYLRDGPDRALAFALRCLEQVRRPSRRGPPQVQ